MTPLVFLDKNEQRNIDILQYMLDTDETIFELDILAEELNLSIYLLEKSITEINQDSLEYDMDECFSQVGQYVYTQKGMSRDTLVFLLTHYFEQSAAKVFFDTLLTEGKISFSSPSISTRFSRANFFKQKHTFETNINYFLSNRPTESEWRSFFYAIYKFFNTSPSLPHKDIPHMIHRIYSEYSGAIPNTPIMKQQLTSLLTISLYRNQHNHLLTEKEFWLKSFEPITQLNELLAPHVSADLTRESTFIAQRFLEEGLLTDKAFNTRLDIYDTRLWQNIYDASMFSMAKIFSDTNTSEYLYLLNKITNTIYVEAQKFEFNDNLHFSSSEYYFKSLYPLLHDNLEHLLNNVTRTHYLSQDRMNEIYFRVMSSILSSNLSIKSTDHVLICVAFSGGINTTRWIMQNITNLNYLNVTLTKDLTDDVDIYISDTPIKNSPMQQVVWIKPPTPNDWFLLGELITKVKQTKYQQ